MTKNKENYEKGRARIVHSCVFMYVVSNFSVICSLKQSIAEVESEEEGDEPLLQVRRKTVDEQARNSFLM